MFVGDGSGVKEGICVGTAVAVSTTTGVTVHVAVGAFVGVGSTSRVKTARVATANSGSATGVGVQPMNNNAKSKINMRPIIFTTSLVMVKPIFALIVPKPGIHGDTPNYLSPYEPDTVGHGRTLLVLVS